MKNALHHCFQGSVGWCYRFDGKATYCKCSIKLKMQSFSGKWELFKIPYKTRNKRYCKQRDLYEFLRQLLVYL